VAGFDHSRSVVFLLLARQTPCRPLPACLEDARASEEREELRSLIQAGKGQVDAEFVARMADVLELYAERPDEEHPVVCFDETPRQLIGESRVPVVAKPGRPARFDYEYVRNGTGLGQRGEGSGAPTQSREGANQVALHARPSAGKARQRLSRRRGQAGQARRPDGARRGGTANLPDHERVQLGRNCLRLRRGRGRLGL
jgi:hypothetical protein